MPELSREDALLYLNDWLGKNTSVDVRIEREGASVSVLSANGNLCHWSGERGPGIGHTGRVIGEMLMGTYAVGGAHFEISEDRLPGDLSLDASRDGRAPDILSISFGGGVELVVTREWVAPTEGSK